MPTPDFSTAARSCYQTDILQARARLSGADLKGKARKFGQRYARSRVDVLSRASAMARAAGYVVVRCGGGGGVPRDRTDIGTGASIVAVLRPHKTRPGVGIVVDYWGSDGPIALGDVLTWEPHAGPGMDGGALTRIGRKGRIWRARRTGGGK